MQKKMQVTVGTKKRRRSVHLAYVLTMGLARNSAVAKASSQAAGPCRSPRLPGQAPTALLKGGCHERRVDQGNPLIAVRVIKKNKKIIYRFETDKYVGAMADSANVWCPRL